MILTAILLVGWCIRENVYAANSPVEEPDNYLQSLVENTLPYPSPPISIPKYSTNIFLSTFDALKTETKIKKENGIEGSVRHLKDLKTKLGPDVSIYANSASDNGSKDENSIESQRKAFLKILDKNAREPRRQKKGRRSSKIKLRYDYINRKYHITEDSED